MGQIEDHDRLTRLESEVKLGQNQILEKLIFMQGNQDKGFEQMRKMHEDHYVDAKNQAITTKGLEVDLVNEKKRCEDRDAELQSKIEHHISGHWKWLTVLAAGLGVLEMLSKLIK